MARFYVMVGIPGCGKTTYARERLGHALRVSFDDLRLMLTGLPFVPRYESAVITAGHALLEELLARANARRQDVLLDATNVDRRTRKRYIKMARAHDVSPVAVYVACDPATALARDAVRLNPVSAAVVARFQARLQPPTLSEGFDEVIEVITEGI